MMTIYYNHFIETTARYLLNLKDGGTGAAARVAIYARLSRNPGGLDVNTSIQVTECLEEALHYVRERGLRAKVIAIFEENDIGASSYSKKERPDYHGLLELVKGNKVDVIFATEVERLMRQPTEAEQLIDLAAATDLREIHLTSKDGYELSTPSGIYGLRQAVNLAERESRKTSERLRRKLADRARNGQT
ncbi:MAG: recombinase family protein, partial [Trebonia sp.]